MHDEKVAARHDPHTILSNFRFVIGSFKFFPQDAFVS
jgi:hypothetical protein